MGRDTAVEVYRDYVKGGSIDGQIIISNSTGYEVDAQTLAKIAEHAAYARIFWSDGRMCHWIYDFCVDGWWVEATRIDLVENVMELNIGQDPHYWDRRAGNRAYLMSR